MPVEIDTTVQHRRRLCALAIIEVCIVLVLAHLSYRAFKHFTNLGRLESEMGLNYSAGTILVLYAVAAIALGRRHFGSFGLSPTGLRPNFIVGLFGGVLLALGAGVMLTLLPISASAFQYPGIGTAVLGGVGHMVVGVLLLLLLKRPDRLRDRRLAAAAAVLLVGILAAPVAAAQVLHRRPFLALGGVGWLFLGAGFGEELFFRGYVQSRINQAFGRPIRILGVPCGFGLLVSALLFGTIHIFNTVDYFTGRFEFAWGSGLMNFFAGLSFGMLREKTGSILASGTAHGSLDVLAQIPRLVEASP